MDGLSELDELIESDILEALGQESIQEKDTISIEDAIDEEILIEDFEEEDLEKVSEVTQETTNDTIKEALTSNNQNITDINSTDLATLLSQLLNNKTIEITIKIKD